MDIVCRLSQTKKKRNKLYPYPESSSTSLWLFGAKGLEYGSSKDGEKNSENSSENSEDFEFWIYCAVAVSLLLKKLMKALIL